MSSQLLENISGLCRSLYMCPVEMRPYWMRILFGSLYWTPQGIQALWISTETYDLLYVVRMNCCCCCCCHWPHFSLHAIVPRPHSMMAYCYTLYTKRWLYHVIGRRYPLPMIPISEILIPSWITGQFSFWHVRITTPRTSSSSLKWDLVAQWSSTILQSIVRPAIL